MRKKLKVIIPIIMAAIMLFIGGAMFINTRAKVDSTNAQSSNSTTILEYTGYGTETSGKTSNLVAYTQVDTSTSAVQTSTSSNTYDSIAKVKVGDYVRYIPTKESYSIASSETGDFSKQEFNPSETTDWIVYNTDNGIEIINEGSVGSLTLKGAAGYKNAVAVLNELSEQYIDSNYAVGARSVGGVANSIPKITAELEYGEGDSNYKDETYRSDVEKIRQYSALENSGSIWLASRNFESDSNWNKYFVRSMMSVGDFDDSNLYSISQYGTEQETAYTRGVRVVVTLKDDLAIVHGDGSKANPYVLSYTSIPVPIPSIPTPTSTPRPEKSVIEFTWDTTGQLEKEFIIEYNGELDILWGDEIGEFISKSNPSRPKKMILSHEYSSEGEYIVRIKGDKITYFSCVDEKIISLDVSKATLLTELNCQHNALQGKLDVSPNTKLEGLYCEFNKLTDLDVSQNTELQTLFCGNNKLKTLDVSNNTKLEFLSCKQETMQELIVGERRPATIDKYENTKIKIAEPNELSDAAIKFVWEVGDNELGRTIRLGTTGKTKIYWGDGSVQLVKTSGQYNHEYSAEGKYTVKIVDNVVKELTISGADKHGGLPADQYSVTELDVSNATVLKELYCSNNRISNLNLVGNTELEQLICENNQISNLDISKNVKLTHVNCQDNSIKDLDLTHNVYLTNFECDRNQLTSLDVSNNTELQTLFCGNNKLKTLDVSNNTKLEFLSCKQETMQELIVGERQPVIIDKHENTKIVYKEQNSNWQFGIVEYVGDIKDDDEDDDIYYISVDILLPGDSDTFPYNMVRIYNFVYSASKDNVSLENWKNEINNLLGKCIVFATNSNNKIEYHNYSQVITDKLDDNDNNITSGKYLAVPVSANNIVDQARLMITADDGNKYNWSSLPGYSLVFNTGTKEDILISKKFSLLSNNDKMKFDAIIVHKKGSPLIDYILINESKEDLIVSDIEYRIVVADDYKEKVGLTAKKYVDLMFPGVLGTSSTLPTQVVSANKDYVVGMEDMVVECKFDESKLEEAALLIDLPAFKKLRADGSVTNVIKSGNESRLAVNFEAEKYVKDNFKVVDTDKLLLRYADNDSDGLANTFGEVEVDNNVVVYDVRDKIVATTFEALRFEIEENGEAYVIPYINKAAEWYGTNNAMANILFIVGPNNTSTPIPEKLEVKVGDKWYNSETPTVWVKLGESYQIITRVNDKETYEGVNFELGDYSLGIKVDSKGVVTATEKYGIGNVIVTTKNGAKVTVQIWEDSDEEEPQQYNFESYKDIKSGDWYYDSGVVEFVTEKGYINGLSEKEFGPDLPMTRGQFISMLYNMAGKPQVTGNNSFKDVKSIHNVDAIVWGNKVGLMSGYPDGTFRPDASIDREQVVTVLKKYAEFIGINTNARANLTTFNDYADVYDWAYDAVSWAIAKGIMKGDNYNRILPHKSATRAEVAAILKNFEAVK